MNMLLQTGIAGAVFVITHLGLSSAAVRNRIVGRLGEKRFLGLYVLIALLTLSWMIAAYAYAPRNAYLWPPGPGLRHLPLLIMPLALILIVGGVTTPNPSAVGMESNIHRPDLVQGILRVTRHPVQWGICLWAAAHLLANGDWASVLFFGAFLLVSGLGSWHLDKRMETLMGEPWRQFALATSYVPFAALLSGRQPWVLYELRRPIMWGLALFGLLLLLHPYLFGVRPY